MQKHMSLKQRCVRSKTLMWKDKQIYQVKQSKEMQEATVSHMVGCFKNVVWLRLIFQQCKYFTLRGIVSDNIFFLLSSIKIKSLFVTKANSGKRGYTNTQTPTHARRVRERYTSKKGAMARYAPASWKASLNLGPVKWKELSSDVWRNRESSFFQSSKYLPRTIGLSFNHGKVNILSFMFPSCKDGTRPAY